MTKAIIVWGMCFVFLIAMVVPGSSSSWLGNNTFLPPLFLVDICTGGKRVLFSYTGGKSKPIKRNGLPNYQKPRRLSQASSPRSKKKRSDRPLARSDRFAFGRRIRRQKKPTLMDGLETVAKQGEAAYKSLFRAAKVVKSSPFEALLLKATWPSDDPIPKPLLRELLKRSIPAFRSSKFPEDDPYHVTTHKLWMKMCESDWRTVVKALVILHSISRESSVRSCRLFSAAVSDMAKQRVPKYPRHRYFDTALITALDKNSGQDEIFKDFIVHYAAYTLYRLRHFSTSGFVELKGLVPTTDPTMSASLSDTASSKVAPESIAILKKANQLVTLGLKCIRQATSRKMKSHVVIASAMHLLEADMRTLMDMLSQYRVQLGSIVQSSIGNSNASLVDVKALVTTLEEQHMKMEEFLTAASAICAEHRLSPLPPSKSKDTSVEPGRREGKRRVIVNAEDTDDDDDDDDDFYDDDDDFYDEEEENDDYEEEEEYGEEEDELMEDEFSVDDDDVDEGEYDDDDGEADFDGDDLSNNDDDFEDSLFEDDDEDDEYY